MAVQAHVSLVRMLSANSGIPGEDLRQRVREEELEHVADDQDREDVGDEVHAPPEVPRLDLGVEAQRDRQRDRVREDRRDDREQEREAVGLQHPAVFEQVDVVRQPDEVPVAVAGVVGEAEEDADHHRQRMERGERDDRRPHHPVEGGHRPLRVAPRAGGALVRGASRRRGAHGLRHGRHVSLLSRGSCGRPPWPTRCRGWRALPARRR